MTVAELILKLQAMPQHLQVSVNDEQGGNFHDTVGMVFHSPADPEYDDAECVVLVVNEED